MSEPYPYDDDVLEEVVHRLYLALPSMYRVPDQPPAGLGELRSLLEVLAAPLAVLRQSIRELHGDLFIDTAHDRMLPYLAEMVGTRLVFPDAESNRRDVRGTVGWRRRKGTAPALEAMGSELTGRPVVLQEGWKRIQVTQDLDIPRPERVVVDVRPAVVSEQSGGPLDALFHAVDVRRISAHTGRYHPRQAAHWLHATRTFPLRRATAVDLSIPPDTDIRYAIDPRAERHALRARRIPGDPHRFVDRIPEQHFAAQPDRWFNRPGGFTIRVCGLAAGVAEAASVERVASTLVAGAQLGRGDVSITVLDQASRGWRGGMRIELGLATVNMAGTSAWRPNPATFATRASLDLDAGGVVSSASTGGATPGGRRVPMLRLTPLLGAPAAYVPGATVELASAAPGSATASGESQLAREGFLAGALHVSIPPTEVRGELLLHVAADGSLYSAGPPGDLADMPAIDDDLFLAEDALLLAGPGAAWPPLPPAAEPRFLNRVPSAPGRGPAILHGARVIRRAGQGFQALPAGAQCALVFAAQIERPGGPRYRPFQRLTWTGPDPSSATWTALNADGTEAADVQSEFAEVAELRESNPGAVALTVRFESTDGAATVCPGEVAWSSDDGRTILVHLPQLDCDETVTTESWEVRPPLGFASAPVRVAEDGSTWAAESTAGRRMSLGAVAPIAEAAGLRRRRVRWRRLCAWDNEDREASPPVVVAPTEAGRLDVDVEHGLFAMSADEPPQAWPPGPVASPDNVTTDYEEGATMHLGARPAARAPILDLRLPRPTRLVVGGGALHADAPSDWHEIPRYASLSAALTAIDARWAALTMDDIESSTMLAEVIQFEDSVTYTGEAPAWPSAPADPSVRARAPLDLTIQAAERERPMVLVDAAQGWAPPAAGLRYRSITLRGIALGAADPADLTDEVAWTGMTFPSAERVNVELCSVVHEGGELRFSDIEDGAKISVTRCSTAGLALLGAGAMRVSDSIVDGPADALRAPAGRVVLERVSVGGSVAVRVLEASEVIFEGPVAVENRFEGCVRYSRVPSNSILPRLHRVSFDTPIRVVSWNRNDPAWWRLRTDCDAAIRRGAENGSEIGAFSLMELAARMEGFERRLEEFTPAGLVSGIITID